MEEIKREFLEMLSSFQKTCDKISFPGVSKSEFMMLQTIYNQGNLEKRIKISDLAARLEISTPAVSRMIKGLSDRNMVLRTQDKADRRITYVSLTDKGEQKRQGCCAKMREIGERTMEVMGVEDMKELVRLSRKLFDSFEDELERYI